jgi:hypothetical protein
MPKRTSKREDEIEAARRVVDTATATPLKPRKKNPAAVALGRLGGPKGGKRRAEVLSAERRREIAAKGAAARWKKP